MSNADWVMQALAEFCSVFKEKYPDKFMSMRIAVSDITVWAEAHTHHYKNGAMTSPWKLGKYLVSHCEVIKQTIGLYPDDHKYGNKIVYRLLQRKGDK